MKKRENQTLRSEYKGFLILILPDLARAKIFQFNLSPMALIFAEQAPL